MSEILECVGNYRETPEEMLDHVGRLVCELIAVAQTNEALAAQNKALHAHVDELSAFIHLAFRDPLTGLRNRRYFETRLEEEVERTGARCDASLSLLMIDVDGFKHINDTWGHQEGDLALQWVAKFLQEHVREHDVCCRTGGDEFTVILPDTNHVRAVRLIERLRSLIVRTSATGILKVRPRLSMGAVTLRVRESAEAFFVRADQAMYRDKAWRKRHRVPA